MYHVDYLPQAIKQLEKLDPQARRMIYHWIDKHLEGCENPRAYGKGLTMNLSGYWRYRVDGYRMICEIQDSRITVLILRIERRDKVYR